MNNQIALSELSFERAFLFQYQYLSGERFQQKVPILCMNCLMEYED